MTDAAAANWTLLITPHQGAPAIYMHLTEAECEKLMVKITTQSNDTWFTTIYDINGHVMACPKAGGTCLPTPQAPQPVTAECFQ